MIWRLVIIITICFILSGCIQKLTVEQKCELDCKKIGENFNYVEKHYQFGPQARVDYYCYCDVNKGVVDLWSLSLGGNCK